MIKPNLCIHSRKYMYMLSCGVIRGNMWASARIDLNSTRSGALINQYPWMVPSDEQLLTHTVIDLRRLQTQGNVHVQYM